MLTLSDQRLTIEAIESLASGEFHIQLDENPAYRARLQAGVDFLDSLLAQEGVIYGVTTGYGDSCVHAVPSELVPQLPVNLSRFHGCGMGEAFSHRQARAIVAVRLCSLAKGYSAVSIPLLSMLVNLLEADLMPVIPQEGSVGASGDLTPLSYLAAVLIGEREVTHNGKRYATAQAFRQFNLTPLKLRPKEGLALMNGTAVMTALACEAFKRAQYLCLLGAKLTAMAVVALKGNAFHFDQKLFAMKPHQGQAQIAALIAKELAQDELPRNSSRLQNRYSIRCAPHIIGVLQDCLPWCREFIENELNSANDNPLIDAQGEHVLHGGHFYGGHIACVMDTMKAQVANLADLFDRQMALLTDPKFNNGLPRNLSAASEERAAINHGFKAVHIAMSAWTAEALKNSMPASVFSRSTECHNQDKVSMGTIAARDCLRVLTLTEQVFAAHLLGVTQAIECRLRAKELEEDALSPGLMHIREQVLSVFDIVEEDRPLEPTLREVSEKIRLQAWSLEHE